MLVNLWVRDKRNGYVHQIGTDQHDSLELIDGKVEYTNLQCMCGTACDGEYEFAETPDIDDYVNITPEQLYLNRKMIHNDLIRKLKEERD